MILCKCLLFKKKKKFLLSYNNFLKFCRFCLTVSPFLMFSKSHTNLLIKTVKHSITTKQMAKTKYRLTTIKHVSRNLNKNPNTSKQLTSQSVTLKYTPNLNSWVLIRHYYTLINKESVNNMSMYIFILVTCQFL